MGPAWDALWTNDLSPEQLSEQLLTRLRSGLERLETSLDERRIDLEELLSLVREAAKQVGLKDHDHLNCERCDGIIARGRTAGLLRRSWKIDGG